MTLPLSDSLWLASLSRQTLLEECRTRWSLYFSGGQEDWQWKRIRWVWYECRERGLEAEFMQAEASERGAWRETERLKAKWHRELLERIPRKEKT